MQLGLTIPLQRRLKISFLPPGGSDILNCWDAHVITLLNKPCLLGVHCASRCVFVLFNPPEQDWADIETTAQNAVRRVMEGANLPPSAMRRHLDPCGQIQCTKTHGRREVAFLNRAWEDVVAASQTVDPAAIAQPLLESVVNSLPCRCAGESGLRPAFQHLRRLLVT